MAENPEINHHGLTENDEDAGVIYTRRLREGEPTLDFSVSTDINKKLLNKKAWIKKERTKKPNTQLASANVSASNIIGMIDTVDRPGDATAEGPYAQSGSYADSPENKPGKRLPKAGAYAEAGVGRARAEFSVFEAEAKGPNASAGAGASVTGVEAMARAEIGSASANAGPLGVRVGLGFDTGISIGANGLEVSFLGIGFSVGPRTSISFLGSEVSCSIL